MKRTVKTLCTVVLAIILAVSNLPLYRAVEAEAASNFKSFPGDGQAAALDIQKVEYMENNMFPSTTSTNTFYMFSEEHGVGGFVVEVPSVVKAYYTWDTTNTSITVSGKSWFSWDVDGVWLVGSKWNLSTPASSSYVYVDPGTYYLNQQFTIKSGNTSSGQYIGITVLVEPIGSTEKVYESSWRSPNKIKTNTEQYGFLSTNAPNDWYQFTIEDYGRLDISYYFYEKGGNNVKAGLCTLYDENHKQLGTYKKSFNTTDYSQNVMTVYLDAGTYFVCLSGCTAPTYLKVGYSSYGITIKGATTEARSEAAHIEVSTGIDATEVLVINKAVSEADKANANIWSTATNITSTMKYDASNGDHTVRVKDKTGQYYLKSFTVKGVDLLPPVIAVDDVENNQTVEADEKMVVITDDGEITKITLNGSKIDLEEYYDFGLKGYVLNLTEKRKYTIKAYDKSGKNSKFVFTLKEPQD